MKYEFYKTEVKLGGQIIDNRGYKTGPCNMKQTLNFCKPHMNRIRLDTPSDVW